MNSTHFIGMVKETGLFVVRATINGYNTNIVDAADYLSVEVFLDNTRSVYLVHYKQNNKTWVGVTTVKVTIEREYEGFVSPPTSALYNRHKDAFDVAYSVAEGLLIG